MGPIAINITPSGVNLHIFWWQYIFKIRHGWLPFPVAFFWLYYLHLSGLSKHCYVFHEYTYLNHFHLLIGFPFSYKIIITWSKYLFSSYGTINSSLLYGLRTHHIFGLGEDWEKLDCFYLLFMTDLFISNKW